MKTIEVLKKRRSYYKIGDKIDVSDEQIETMISEVLRLVPDAYNIKSQETVLVLGDQHKKLWDEIYNVFDGKVSRDKIDSFKNGYGTILFYINRDKVEKLENNFPKYKENFEPWSREAMGMLQISVWNVLREMDLGASLQHYNPVIDEMVKEMFDVEDNRLLVGQMVFGNILEEREPKPLEKIEERYKVYK